MSEHDLASAPLKILIVDDEESIRFTLSCMLSALGYTVVLAQDAIVAHAVCAAQGIDIAIVDRLLPDGNGIDIIRMIKEKHPACETILMSAYPTVNSACELVQYGVLAYMIKPFRHAEMKSIVARAEQKICSRRCEEQRASDAENLRNLGELISCIAHELGTPLQAITGYAELAMQITDNDSMVSSQLAHILASAEKIDVLRKKLINAHRSREQTGATLVKPHAILDDVVSFLADTGMIKHISVCRDFMQDLPLIEADAAALHAVFANFIINAAYAMEHAREKRINLHASFDARQNMVSVSVADTGCGIEPHNREKIFKPYFTTRADSGGTGLGLHIAKNIVEKHGGTISVTSTIGQGACFTVCLPAAQEIRS